MDVLNAFLSANGLSAYIAAFADNEYDSLDDILEGVVGEESESALVKEIAAALEHNTAVTYIGCVAAMTAAPFSLPEIGAVPPSPPPTLRGR